MPTCRFHLEATIFGRLLWTIENPFSSTFKIRAPEKLYFWYISSNSINKFATFSDLNYKARAIDVPLGRRKLRSFLCLFINLQSQSFPVDSFNSENLLGILFQMASWNAKDKIWYLLMWIRNTLLSVSTSQDHFPFL